MCMLLMNLMNDVFNFLDNNYQLKVLSYNYFA